VTKHWTESALLHYLAQAQLPWLGDPLVKSCMNIKLGVAGTASSTAEEVIDVLLQTRKN
jgi:hypothetical protein